MDNIFLTGTANGVIKAWKAPLNSQVDQYGKDKDQNFCVQSWEDAHQG